MSVEAWVAYVLMSLVVCISPGPTVFYVSSQAMSGGVQRAARATAGIEIANAGFFAVTAAGLMALLVQAEVVFEVLRWVGVAYLVYLGGSALIQAARSGSVGAEASSRATAPLIGGFVLQIGNPKTLLFFTALLPQFLDTNAGLTGQILVLGLTTITIETVVLLSYGVFAGQFRSVLTEPLARRCMDGVRGALFITVAGVIATTTRG